MNLSDLLSPESLTVNQQEICDLIGIEAYKKLSEYFGGTDIYIAKPKGMRKNLRDQKIISEFTGSNTKGLAVKWGLCESTIRKITAEKRRQLKKSALDGQEMLF